MNCLWLLDCFVWVLVLVNGYCLLLLNSVVTFYSQLYAGFVCLLYLLCLLCFGISLLFCFVLDWCLLVCVLWVLLVCLLCY